MNDSRIEVRLSSELRARVEAEAAHRGQSLAVFVRRALEAALPSERAVPAAPPRAPSRPKDVVPEVPLPKIAPRRWK